MLACYLNGIRAVRIVGSVNVQLVEGGLGGLWWEKEIFECEYVCLI